MLKIIVVDTNFEFSKTLPFTKNGLEELKKIIEFLETQTSDYCTKGEETN
jgi:hypothetical protein